MLNTNLFFILILTIGLGIIYPLTPRYFSNTKKLWVTIGAVLFHIGLYGLLWLHLVHVLTLSLFFVEGGIFVLWNPLHIFAETYRKPARLVGNLLIACGAIISVSYYTLFPFWPWAIPAIGFLIPFLIPPLRRYSKLILTLSTLLILLYGSIIGYRVYNQFRSPPQKVIEVIEAPEITPTPLTEGVPTETTPTPPPIVTPPPTPGPLSEAIHEADEKLKGVDEENVHLKEQVETLQNQIKANQEKIEELKKLVNDL